jgi:hypothetical protein
MLKCKVGANTGIKIFIHIFNVLKSYCQWLVTRPAIIAVNQMTGGGQNSQRSDVRIYSNMESPKGGFTKGKKLLLYTIAIWILHESEGGSKNQKIHSHTHCGLWVDFWDRLYRHG